MQIRAYRQSDISAMVEIWNEIVDSGDAFPQEEHLNHDGGAEFFAAQTYTAVAENDAGDIVGLYILHPNNIGRCSHIGNASYAVASHCRNQHIGEALVKDCLDKAGELGFLILQFNAVVKSNIHARHLYDRLGFTELGTIPGGFRMRDGHYEDICLYYHPLKSGLHKEREIKIIEGHDPSSYFWFQPAETSEEGKILWDNIVYAGEEFSIEEGDVECFLAYFLFKYFDDELTYNRRRYDEYDAQVSGFKWYLTDNFYTYDTMRELAGEIASTADLLESDYDNPALDEIKRHFSIYYMCNRDDPDYGSDDLAAVKRHISVVTDFYRRFALRINSTLDNNPDMKLISVMGP